MLYQVILPLLLTFVPWLAVRYVFTAPQTRHLPYLRHAWCLWAAAAVWAVGFALPNLAPTDQTDTFSLHTAGGVAAGFLWLYSVKAYRVRFLAWWHAPLSLYFMVSGLGALNELFEVLLNAVGWEVVYNLDAQWDLVANTCGAAIFYGLWLVLWRRWPQDRDSAADSGSAGRPARNPARNSQ